MNCPPEVAEIVLEIIKAGILRARAAAWSGDAARSAAEADHVHNLPDLLLHYSPELLKFYWATERTAFLHQFPPDLCVGFEPLWERLRGYVPVSEGQALTR